MAKKSKTQRQKASAAKANKKDREEREALAAENADQAAEESGEESKGGLLKKKEAKPEAKQQPAAAAKKEEKKPKKVRFQFLRDVRAEMKRVTWPTRQDVVRWTGVVVGALLFFGVYVAVLDNLIITPALLALGSVA
ncbi:MAG: preprotein translocase subunit SecE [Eggerthellaceae bacterium]|nr:preprotein translocase subunit SecE [Eggerthellaceae bacterium]